MSSELETLEETLASVASADIDELIARGRLGTTFAFNGAEDPVERIKALAAELASLPLSELPTKQLSTLNKLFSGAITKFDEMKLFDPTSHPSAGDRRVQILNQLNGTAIEIWNGSYQLLSFLRTSSSVGSSPIEHLREVETRAATILASLAEKQTEAERILDAQRTASAETGVSRHAGLFLTQANEHRKAARWWLTALVGLGGVALFAAGGLLYPLYKASSTIAAGQGEQASTGQSVQLATGQGVQLAIGKLVLFSLVYFMLVVVAKSYRANMHNYVVNKHRHNALMTFETFSTASGDEATKSAVLLRTTEAIFSRDSSGHHHGSDTEAPPVHQILEIVRSGSTKS